MKQKDVILIVVIAVVAGILSFIISGLLFVTPENQQQKVEVAPVITTQFTTPSLTSVSSTWICEAADSTLIAAVRRYCPLPNGAGLLLFPI
jgi:hypothetical protein